MKYKSIIFDFDGVIIDSNRVKDKAFYSIFYDYGEHIASYSLEYHLENRGVSRFDKVNNVIKKFKLPKKDYTKINKYNLKEIEVITSKLEIENEKDLFNTILRLYE